MRINAGRLTRRVRLLRPAIALDADGAPMNGFSAAGDRWAARLKYTARLLDRDAQRQTVAGVGLLLRLDSLTAQIDARWRIRLDGQELAITGLEADPEDGSLIITGAHPEP